MKKVLSGDITSTARQPYTKVTHEFYNAMVKELGDSVIRMQGMNDNASFIVLWGCVNSGAPNANISAGAIWYNGEIYPCDAFVDGTISDAIVGTITTTYDAADPILFTDNNSHNVHQINKIVWSDAVSGSGDVDYSDVIFKVVEGSYVPTMRAYNSAGALIGTVANTDAVYYKWSLSEKCLFIMMNLTSIDFPANTNMVDFSTPDDVPLPNPKSFLGMTYADVYVSGGSVYPSMAFIELLYTGAGYGLSIQRIDKSNYGAITGLTIKFAIHIQRN
jgi:hypothetical protein